MNKYLAKILFIIEKDSNQLSIHPNEMKLRNHVIDKLETYFIMPKNTAISSMANIQKKLHNNSNVLIIYQKDFYKYKQNEIYELFI